MTTKADETKTLFPWPDTLSMSWYTPGSTVTDMLEAQMNCLQHCARDLQKAYADTYRRQMDVFFETGALVTQSMQDLRQSQDVGDVLKAESQLATAMLDGAAQRAQTWVELSRKLQDCCADLARASIEELPAQSAVANTAAPETRKPVKSATKHAA